MLRSAVALLPCDWYGTASVSTVKISGRKWTATTGALAWAERQMAQGAELPAVRLSEWAWRASTPVITRARKTQTNAITRTRLLVSNWPLRATRKTMFYLRIRQAPNRLFLSYQKIGLFPGVLTRGILLIHR